MLTQLGPREVHAWTLSLEAENAPEQTMSAIQARFGSDVVSTWLADGSYAIYSASGDTTEALDAFMSTCTTTANISAERRRIYLKRKAA